MMNKIFIISLLILSLELVAQEKVFPGADEKTPSKAQYFSWINNTNEGSTEEQTQINLDFFAWLKSEYGMQLDIYAFDAGAIDGKRFYGSIKSDRFKKQFPYSFDSIYRKANSLGIRLGVWGGPDGFGDSPEEEKERTRQMVSLCKDYEFALFKFDAVCGPLRPEKEDAFINMMKECRSYSPDLILLNHRLGLEKAKPYATTFLWGGEETYIDVFMTNNQTAPHHRAAALNRGLVPDLKRLTEDHGVCISSCLDYWDDDLVLQAFNRSLILAPEIYGNPWLLRDDEFAKLARIYNLHQKYGDILVNGIVLPEDQYGKNAVSRGDDKTRFITLRNISWDEKTYTITLNKELGLTKGDKFELFQIHPYEKYLGKFEYGKKVKVKLAPFRSALFLATAKKTAEPVLVGIEYQLLRDVPGKSILLDIVGMPGTENTIRLLDSNAYKSVKINGINNTPLLAGKSTVVKFPGERLSLSPHRKIVDLNEIKIPQEVEALYEASIYAADNNALEVRSIKRSGYSKIPVVRKAQDAFFNQEVFVNRGIWDKNLFDGDLNTGFYLSKKYDYDSRIKGGAFRLDLGEVIAVDELIFYMPNTFALNPLLPQEGNYVEVSSDLKVWETLTYLADTRMTIPIHRKLRYLRFKSQPQQIMEIEGYFQGKQLDRSLWRASNLFAHPDRIKCQKVWSNNFVLDEIAEASYLSIALNGKHGIEGAYVAAKIDGELIGAPDRSPSYPSNTWEYLVAQRDANYTYYILMKEEYVGKNIEVFVMAYDENHLAIEPEVWISSFTDGKVRLRMEIER